MDELREKRTLDRSYRYTHNVCLCIVLVLASNKINAGFHMVGNMSLPTQTSNVTDDVIITFTASAYGMCYWLSRNIMSSALFSIVLNLA